MLLRFEDEVEDEEDSEGRPRADAGEVMLRSQSFVECWLLRIIALVEDFFIPMRGIHDCVNCIVICYGRVSRIWWKVGIRC